MREEVAAGEAVVEEEEEAAVSRDDACWIVSPLFVNRFLMLRVSVHNLLIEMSTDYVKPRKGRLRVLVRS